MKQILFTIAVIVMTANMYGQTEDIPNMNDDEIQELYWKYRNTLRNNFGSPLKPWGLNEKFV